MVNEYTPKLCDIARQILKDEALLKSKDPEVIAFMQSLSLLLIKYDTATKVDTKAEVMEFFGRLAMSFAELPKDKVTHSTQLMQETLQRYGMIREVEELQKAFQAVMAA